MASAPVLSRERPSRRTGLTLRVSDRDEIVDIVETARARYPERDIAPVTALSDCAAALNLLDALWHEIIDALTNPSSGTTPSDTGGLELLSRMKSAISRIQSIQTGTALAGLRHAIADLEEIDDADHLLQRAAVATTTLGYDRALVSTVWGGTWVPAAGYIERDPGWATEIVGAGQASPEIIDATLPEAEMVRRLRPIVVEDVGKVPRYYEAVIEAAKGTSYVAAPIVANRTVIGFVHADTFYRARLITDNDIHLLSLFGEFLGSAMSRLTMLGELRALRAEIDGISTRAAELERNWSGSTHRPARRRTSLTAVPAAQPQSSSRTTGALDALTRRELEVLELVAEGATNRRIARALTISEGTVKGHMKHIMRKLGTANRAEAVSYWLRMTVAPPGCP